MGFASVFGVIFVWANIRHNFCGEIGLLGQFLCFPFLADSLYVFLQCCTEFLGRFGPLCVFLAVLANLGGFAILPFLFYLVTYSVQHCANVLPIFT